MKLKEFVEMLQECAVMVRAEQEMSEGSVAMANALYRPDCGIQCRVCVNENGELSDTETCNVLQFTIPAPKSLSED